MNLLGVRPAVRVFGTRDERIGQIARDQRGRVARRQLRQAGISDDATDRRVANGQLVPEHRAVLALRSADHGPLTRETSALLACRPGTLLSHLSAAQLWGLVRPGDPDRPVDVLIAGGYIADFYWPVDRLVLEVDGYAYHSTKTAFERDRRKDAAFRAAGLDVIRISSDQAHDEPYFLIALVAMAIARHG